MPRKEAYSDADFRPLVAIAEGVDAERTAVAASRSQLLTEALLLIQADLHLMQFCRWVYNVTAANGQPLVKSYEEIADRPEGLWCEVSKARRTVTWARQSGLVRIEERRDDRTGGQLPNAYEIDWDGVRGAIQRRRSGGPIRDRGEPRPPAHSAQPPAHSAQPPAHSAQPPAHPEHHTKEIPSFRTVFVNTGPDRKAGTDPDELFYERYQELRQSRNLPVASLPSGDGRCGIYGDAMIGLEFFKNLAGPLAWYRRQLDAVQPGGPPHAAGLLLALSAWHYARNVPRADVRRNRPAIFVQIHSRRQWQRAVPFLPQAARDLQGLLERYGEAVLVGAWPPQRLAAAVSEGER